MTIPVLKKLIATAGNDMKGTRDRAVHLTSFVGGFRASEQARITVENLTWHRRGITVHLPASKTDQEGKGRDVELPYGSQPKRTPAGKLLCPVEPFRLG